MDHFSPPQIYRILGKTVVCYPIVFDLSDFYLSQDVMLLIDDIKVSWVVSHLTGSSWRCKKRAHFMFHTLSIFLYKERIKCMAENGQWTETFPINHQCQPRFFCCLHCINAFVVKCVLQNALQFIKQSWKMPGRPLFLVLIREDNIK